MNYAINYVVVLMCATLGPLLVGVLLIFEIWSIGKIHHSIYYIIKIQNIFIHIKIKFKLQPHF